MIKKRLSLLLVLLLVLNSFSFSFADKLENVDKTDLLDDSAPVRVIVEVEGDYGLNLAKTMSLSVSDLDEADQAKIVDQQQDVMSELEDTGIAMDVHESFTNVLNGFSMTVDERDIQAIEKTQGVKAVYRVNEYERPEPDMKYSGEYVNLDKALNYRNGKYDGRGTVVAVIDSGVDYTHKDMRLDYPENAKLSENAVTARVHDNNLGGKYFTEKVPYGYNYFDKNDQVIDKGDGASMHGMHVAGTVAANGNDEGINGIAPEAQVLAMKVFSNNPNYPSTYGDIIIEAIDEAIAMDADVINMSLGATAGTPNSTDLEQMAVQRALDAGIVCAISAGNSSFSGNGYLDESQLPVFATDMGVTGSPSVTPESITVASLENKKLQAKTLEYKDKNNKTVEIFIDGGTPLEPDQVLEGQVLEAVFCGTGGADEFEGINVIDKVALIERGGRSFKEKIDNAMNNGAVAAIIFNHETGGEALMGMGGVDDCEIPAAFMGRSDGLNIKDNGGTVEFTGKNVTVDNVTAGQMSDFSSWGTPITLDIKPEITAPGGDILSTFNNDTYGMMSGTSMASPHIAGASASIIQRVRDDFNLKGEKVQEMVKLLMMNTASPKISEGAAHDKFKDQYVGDFPSYNSPRQQGAGILDLYGALETPVTVTEKRSGLGEVSLGEISASKGEIEFDLMFKNYGDSPVTYNLEQQINTVALFGNYIWADDMPVVKEVKNGGTTSYERLAFDVKSDGYDKDANAITVPANDTLKVTFSIDLDEEDALAMSTHQPLLEAFENGTFVEGFLRFIDKNDVHADLAIPFLGYYGDWDKLPIIDKTMYADDTNEELYGMGLFLDQEQNYLGYIEYDDSYSLYLSDMVIGHVTNQFGKQTGSNGIFGKLSLLRNAAELKYTVLDANGKTVETIAHNKDGRRKNYYDAGASGETSKLVEGFWDGMINGEPAPNGQYTYRISAKIAGDDADWQHYDYPLFVDNCTPQITGLTANMENGKVVSVTIETKANEILVRDKNDPSKILSRTEVAEGKYRGIRKFGLMETSNGFKSIKQAANNIVSMKDVHENTAANSDGSYTLMPYVIGENGALIINPEFIFTFKDGVPVTGGGGDKGTLSDIDFSSLTIHKDTSLSTGKVLEPEFTAVYKATSTGAITMQETFTEDVYWIDDYDNSVLTFKKSLDTKDTVKLDVEESFDVKAGKTQLVAVYPVTDAMKAKLNSADALSSKYVNEVKAFVEDSGYKFVDVATKDNLISSITASPEVASLNTTSGSAITITMGKSPQVAKASVLDGFKEGTDYLYAYTLVTASNDEYTEPSTAVLDDIQPPTVIIDTPEFWGELTDESSNISSQTVDGKKVYYVDFKGHVTDESALTDLKLDGQDLEHAFNNRTGAWEFSGKMPVKDGLNEFKILANDKAGNLIEFRQAFFVDLYAPVLSIDSKRTQFKRQGDTYYVRLNGYVSDTFPMLQLKVGKNLVVNESESFAEYNDLLKPMTVELKNLIIPIEKNQETLYFKLTDFGGHTITEKMDIPQYIFTAAGNKKDKDDKKKSSGKSSGGGSSKGGSSSASTSANDKKDGSTKVSATAFSKDKMTSDGRVVIKAPAPAEKKEVKLNLDKAAIKAAQSNKAVLEIDAGIAKLQLDSENLKGQNSESAELSISAVKDTKVKVQKQEKSEVVETLKPVGDIIDIKLNLDNSSKAVHELSKPVVLEIPVSLDASDVDVDKLGLFYNNEETNAWEYVGGNYDAGSKTFKATLSHFSQYCIMERDIAFNDTDAHWAQSVIEKIASKDIVAGYADGSFKPDGTITHAEFLTLVVKALDLETTYEGEKWYDAYIFASKANGLISPTAEFDPESNITREEMAEILGQYLETKKIEPKYDPIKFIDESAIDSDSFEAVNSAVRYGLFSGRADGSFDPDATATRAEVAQVIFDLVQLVQ